MFGRKPMKLHLKTGALHRELGVPEGDKIPAAKIEAASHKGGLEAKRANFAKNAAKWKHPGKHGGERKSHPFPFGRSH